MAKTFKGLKIPGVIKMTPVLIQSAKCFWILEKGDCGSTTCSKCIYDEKNLKQFKEWEKGNE